MFAEAKSVCVDRPRRSRKLLERRVIKRSRSEGGRKLSSLSKQEQQIFIHEEERLLWLFAHFPSQAPNQQ